jgi:succinyl-CoA synthetase beta subunit
MALILRSSSRFTVKTLGKSLEQKHSAIKCRALSSLVLKMAFDSDGKQKRPPVDRGLGVKQQVRWLNIHEYQSMNHLKKFEVPHPKYDVASTPEEAEKIAKEIGGRDFVVKAQVLAGGRGKGRFKGGLQGGVHVAVGVEKVKELASKMLGDYLVTKQTGEVGKPCHRVLITERLYLRAEKYFAILMDREFGGPVLVGSPAGGMDIEKVAQDTPQLIFKEPVDIVKGVQQESLNQWREIWALIL